MSKNEPDEREQRIDELLEVKAGGVGAGICGREWCEACGQQGSFSGFCSAMAAHTAANRFVCGSCSHGKVGAGNGGASVAKLDELILERGYRYCASCGQEVILGKRTVEEARRLPFTCPACHGQERGEAARRRYLEHEATKQGGLERAAGHIYWAKAGIERILEETEDPS